VIASAKFSHIVLYMLDLFVNKPLATISVLFKTEQFAGDKPEPNKEHYTPLKL
jgi:hypothetical protein